MIPDDRNALEALYSETVYEVALPGGPLTFVVGPNRHHLAPFVIITAYNPGAERPSHFTNEAANARLEERLRTANYHFVAASGGSQDASHVEPSFAVFDITVQQAMVLAREFRQAAVFAWDGTTGAIVWCDGT